MKITLFSMSKGTQEIEIPEGATAVTLRENGHVEYTVSLKRNGQNLSGSDRLNDGDVVAALPKLKGGR